MLLTDLTLGYELLADDPIEVGIHYGKSVLNVLSSSVMSAARSVEHTLGTPVSRRLVVGRTQLSSHSRAHQTAQLVSRNTAYQIPHRETLARRPILRNMRSATAPVQTRTLVGAM